jgi:hypothetical protein
LFPNVLNTYWVVVHENIVQAKIAAAVDEKKILLKKTKSNKTL